jgi:predicted Ser/Thr protein kinase
MESIVREIARELKESQVPDKYRPISFEEYLKMVFEDPRLVRNAYQRLYDMILSHGTHIVKVHDKEVIGSCASPTVGSSTAKSCSSSKKSFSMIFCMPPKSTSSSPRRTRA